MNTPLHIFTVRLADGTLRRKVIPGGYCQGHLAHARALTKLAPGDEIIDRTWRSDWRFLSHRSDSQPDYQRAA